MSLANAARPGDRASFQAIVALAAPWLRIAGEGEPRLPLAELLRPGRMEEYLSSASRGYPAGPCAKAAASVWSKSLVAPLIAAPALAALAGSRIEPAPDLLWDGDKVAAVAVQPPSQLSPEPDFAAFGAYVEETLEAVVRRLAEASGLAARVFWSNAATMLAYLYEGWSRILLSKSRAELLKACLLDAPRLPGSLQPNPLYGQIVYVPCSLIGRETGVRRRKICCLRDMIGQPLCASCPKITTKARDALLAAATR